ncbi:MAG: DUF6677 family protein [Planctomycetales bacterium]
MTDPRIDLKSPWIAFALAFLIPGAGHLYQGRTFKGLLYMTCILGTFSYGLALGQGHVVYRPTHSSVTNYYGYYAQALVGLPAIPALVQSRRYEPPPMRTEVRNPDHRDSLETEKRDVLEAPLAASFSGRIDSITPAGQRIQGETTGRLALEPAGDNGRAVRGTFAGTLPDGTPVELVLAGPLRIGPKVCASENVRPGEGPPEFSGSRRYLRCEIIDPADDRSIGKLEGTVPRAFWNWFGVPPSSAALDDFNRRLGKVLELALVCTWIAGLLNLLAIWDAVEGPAYGYGDQPPQLEAGAARSLSASGRSPVAAEGSHPRDGQPARVSPAERKD